MRLGRGDGTFGAVRSYVAGEGGAVALEIGYLDDDGDKDLVAANRGGTQVAPADCTIPGSVFLNKGGGAFAPARDFEAGKAYQSRDLYRSDLDTDGDEDLAVALGPGCGAAGTGGWPCSSTTEAAPSGLPGCTAPGRSPPGA